MLLYPGAMKNYIKIETSGSQVEKGRHFAHSQINKVIETHTHTHASIKGSLTEIAQIVVIQRIGYKVHNHLDNTAIIINLIKLVLAKQKMVYFKYTLFVLHVAVSSYYWTAK